MKNPTGQFIHPQFMNDSSNYDTIRSIQKCYSVSGRRASQQSSNKSTMPLSPHPSPFRRPVFVMEKKVLEYRSLKHIKVKHWADCSVTETEHHTPQTRQGTRMFPQGSSDSSMHNSMWLIVEKLKFRHCFTDEFSCDAHSVSPGGAAPADIAMCMLNSFDEWKDVVVMLLFQHVHFKWV